MMTKYKNKQILLVLPLIVLACLTAWFYTGYKYALIEQDLLVEKSKLTESRADDLSVSLKRNLFFMSGISEMSSHLVLSQEAAKRFGSISVPSSLEYASRKSKWTNDAQLNNLSKYFSVTQKSLNIDILFLVNAAGDCIVASNWDKKDSSIGTNFADRDWFKSNNAGKAGMQYAMGKTTHKPGLYFSSPILINGQIMGAVVTKVDADRLSDVFTQTNSFVADHNGVIIFAHDSKFELMSLPESRFSGMTFQQKFAQYQKGNFQQFPIKLLEHNGAFELFDFKETGIPHLMAHRQLDELGMTTYVINDLPELKALKRERSLVFYILSILGSCLILFILGLVTYVKNIRKSNELLQDSELHLRTIIENEPECIKTVDAQGHLLEMSPAGLAMIEADSLEQVVGLLVEDLIAPECRDAYTEMH